jgi:hypothetical protein
LYGEEHRHGEAIGAVVEKDIRGNKDDGKVDLLIVAGTTLHIPGVKRMIKEFARVLRSKPPPKKPAQKSATGAGIKRKPTASQDDAVEGGEAEDDEELDDELDFPVRTIFLNMDPPGRGKGGEWADVFDVWVQGNLQEFVKEWVEKPRDTPRRSPRKPLPLPRADKRQIMLSAGIPLGERFQVVPGPVISVKKTGDLKLTLSVKREGVEDPVLSPPPAAPSRKRKAAQLDPVVMVPETPPKSRSGRSIKPSEKLLSAKKRRRTTKAATTTTTTTKPTGIAAFIASVKQPRTPTKTPTTKTSTRQPRNSTSRRHVRDNSPSPAVYASRPMSERSSSPLSSAPPSSDDDAEEEGAGNVSGETIRSIQVDPSLSVWRPAATSLWSAPPHLPTALSYAQSQNVGGRPYLCHHPLSFPRSPSSSLSDLEEDDVDAMLPAHSRVVVSPRRSGFQSMLSFPVTKSGTSSSSTGKNPLPPSRRSDRSTGTIIPL